MAPYYYVQKQSFRNIIWSADPKWKPLGRSGLCSILSRKYKESMSSLKELLLVNKGYLSTELDIWSDRLLRSFAGVSCRLVTTNFQVNFFC